MNNEKEGGSWGVILFVSGLYSWFASVQHISKQKLGYKVKSTYTLVKLLKSCTNPMIAPQMQ